MSFNHIAQKHKRDRDFPQRTFELSVLKSILDGTFYDVLPYAFHQERTSAGEPILLADRKPCVTVGTDLLRTVVEDSVAMLFGEGRFPEFETSNEATRAALNELKKETKLVQLMREAAYRGSVGSVAIRTRILNKRVFFDVFDTVYLTPEWDPQEPDVLIRITERYKVNGEELAARGYDIDQDDFSEIYWFQRVWDTSAETWFQPWKVSREETIPQVDNANTVQHGLGFCPWVWIKNTYGGNGVDGGCTFRPAIDTCVTMDALMSQASRGLKYTQDPLMVIKEPPTAAQLDGSGFEVEKIAGHGYSAPVKSPASVLTIDSSEGGDAKFLEIDGSASRAVIEYVAALRDNVLETLHGNRIDPAAIGAGPRGAKALEILNAPLIALTNNLMTAYGEDGLLPLLKMVLRVAKARGGLKINGKMVPASIGDADDLSLRWPPRYPSTEQDRQAQAMTLTQLVASGLMSQETAVKCLASEYDIEDVVAEIQLIQTEQQARLEAEQAEPGAPKPGNAPDKPKP